MADFAPPTGPPPPRVPEGWKAVWNDQYKEWFYVNLHTKQSSWEKPTEPAPRPGDTGAGHSDQMPPSYSAGANAPTVSDTKQKPLESNNPYGNTTTSAGSTTETDEQLARRLQAEYDASQKHGASGTAGNTASTDRGQSDSYYNSGGGGAAQPAGNQGSSYQSQQQQQTSSSTDRGLFGKLKSKLSGASANRPPQQGYGGYGGYPQQQQYGGYPQQQQYGGGYGGYGGGGGYPQQQPMYMAQQQQAPRRSGMGAGGAAALGVGGGLLGGMLIADAMDDHNDYQEGYQDGYDQGDDGGGGDFGGGDF